MTEEIKRLDAIIGLLVLLVNQMESQASHSQSIRYNLMQDNIGDFQDFGKVFRPPAELLSEVAAAVEAIKRDSTERQSG